MILFNFIHNSYYLIRLHSRIIITKSFGYLAVHCSRGEKATQAIVVVFPPLLAFYSLCLGWVAAIVVLCWLPFPLPPTPSLSLCLAVLCTPPTIARQRENLNPISRTWPSPSSRLLMLLLRRRPRLRWRASPSLLLMRRRRRLRRPRRASCAACSPSSSPPTSSSEVSSPLSFST